MDTSLAVTLLAAVVGAAAAAGVVRARSARRLDAAARDVAAARDELRRSQRSSEEARDVQNLILSSMQDGVLLVDASGRTLFANAALAHLLGDIPTGTAAMYPLALRRSVERSIEEGAPTSAIVELAGPQRWLRVSATPTDDGESVLVVLRDVTQARLLDAIRRDFVTNASHELKTPAASIQATAEALGQAAIDDPEAVGRFARQLEREAVRLSRIVSDLLDLSRLEAGSELEEDVRLDVLVREELPRFRENAERARLELTADAATPALVHGNVKDLTLLVRNLVDNAIRYTEAGGSVHVSVSVEDAVLLRVSDTGIGIPHRELSRVFERFYRIDRARSRETGGTGLGLAIVKHVAENVGGTVSVESELGAGTTFVVSLPQAPTEAPIA